MSKFIDKIIYINLNKRTDRKELIEKELNRFGLPFERYAAIETHGFGTLGCGLSHLNVLKLAKERGYRNVLILEDDFTFLVNKQQFEEELTSFFVSNINYDVCMISYSLIHHQETQYDFLFKVIEAQTASGYIVHANYFDALIELYELAMPLLEQTKEHWNYANDQVWRQYQPRHTWVCFKTRIGKQRAGYSDNAEMIMDYEV
jgi:glycosyl transferase family 25